MVKKLKLAIISEAIRRDNHAPLRYFDEIEVKHFYHRSPYGDLTADELAGAVQYQNYRDLWRELVNFRPDVLQGPEPYASRMALRGAWFAYRVAPRLKAKLIFPVLENIGPFERFGGLTGLMLREALRIYGRRADTAFCLNRGARMNLLQAGVEGAKIIHFPWGIWGVDTTEFTSRRDGREPAWTIPTVLFVGRLIPDKGLGDLLAGFLELRSRVGSVQLVIIGDGPYRQKLIDQITAQHLGEQVQLLGTIKNRDLPPYFRAATVTAYPSITLSYWKEQVGTVNLQSMACSTPVVSTYSGAIPEYVPDGIAGILIPEHSPGRLADALDKILADRRMRDQMGQAGREYILKRFSAQKNVKLAQQWLINRFAGGK